MIKTIQTADAPQPLGHYAQGTVYQGTIYVAGQLPIDPKNADNYPQTMADQVTLTLQNLLAVVEAGGGSKESILKVTVFMADLALWPEANKAYEAFFGAHKPARTAIPAPAIPKGFLVEIDAIAAVI